MNRRLRTVAAAAALSWFGGCTRGDPWDQTVSAASPTAFQVWQAKVTESFPIEDQRRINDAFQEIRLKIMGDREIKRAMDEPRAAISSGSIEDELRAKIHGKPVRETVQLGYELRVRRLKMDLVGLEDAMAQNAQLVTKPGDLESRRHLDGLRDRQKARVEKYREEIAATERELAPFAKATGKVLVPVDAPDVAPLQIKAGPPVK